MLLCWPVAAMQVAGQGPAAAPAPADGFDLPPVPANRPPFFLGVATAAPQIEGAVNEDGRSPSIWDTWAVAHPNSDSPNVTDDFYHKWAEDIRIMQSYGIKFFRFSVAWTRIIPDGNGSTNAAGLAFYSRLVDALLAAGIQPVVTLYHWDLPQARLCALDSHLALFQLRHHAHSQHLEFVQVLQDRYGGFLNEQIVADFTQYAQTMFQALGSRVTYWSTFNEPATFCVSGYGSGWHAPSMTVRVLPFRAVSHASAPAHADTRAPVHRTSMASRAMCGSATTMSCERTPRPSASFAGWSLTARSA